MQLIVDIKDKNLADKIIWFLKVFQDKGVKILNYKEKENDLDNKKSNEEFVKKHWREIGMNTHSADRDDDEYLYEAAWEFYNEKYSD